MDEEELEPRRRPDSFEPRNLEPLSLEELAAYIDTLKAEIARVEAEMSAKKKVRSGAESLFKS